MRKIRMCLIGREDRVLECKSRGRTPLVAHYPGACNLCFAVLQNLAAGPIRHILERVLNFGGKQHHVAESSVSSILRRFSAFPMCKPFLSEFITSLEDRHEEFRGQSKNL